MLGFGAGAAGQRQREIVGANKHTVQSFGIKDGVKIRQPFAGFDHCQRQDLVVSVLWIITAAVE